MAKGKYAARAANRMAQLDGELIADLRQQLGAATVERDAVRRELEALRRDTAIEARRVGVELAGAEIRALQQKLTDEHKNRVRDRERLSDEVFEVFRRNNGTLPVEGYLELAELFGSTSKFGQYLTGGEASRIVRRLNGRGGRRLLDQMDDPSLFGGVR